MKQFFWNKILNRVGVIMLLLLFALSQANGNDTLLSPPSRQGNIISVGIITPEMPIGNEVVIGKVNKSEKKMGDSHFKGMVGNSINLDHTIVQSFEDSYIIPFYESHNYENYSGILKPKIFLKPVIKSLNLELQGGKLLKSLSGKCNISCTWNIYTANDKNKIISTININSMVERKEENYELILHTLIRQSAKDLLAIDTLHNYFEQLQLKYLAETVGAKLVVKGAKANGALTKKEAFKLAKDAAVTISTQNGFGSGVIITNDGYIITNHHVVADSGEIKVRFNNGTEFNAKLIKSNPDFDVALIKIESKTDKLM